MDRAQRVDEENGVICSVILFTTWVMVIKMSQLAHFFVFTADGNKKPCHSLGKVFKCI